MDVRDIQSDISKKDLYFGLDFSTQQLKAVVINDDFRILHEAAVNFDLDLPEFRTHGGVKKTESTITSPTIMWVKALDLLMDRLRLTGLDFHDVAALSGAGQQHGSVYWKKGAEEVLKNLDSGLFLSSQLTNSFSIPDSPVWMDSSTQVYCKKLEDKIGGPQKLAELTGSRAHERFTGNQIAKILDTKPESYFNTERISLVSSFGCSLFLGRYSQIDSSDGSGMNLMDISTKDWDPHCLHIAAPELKNKLGNLVASHECLGSISSYFVERYGFNPDCQVIAFTGDNPASLAGMCLQSGELAISLGTSDTLFLWLDHPTPSLEGHLFSNPIDPEAFMALLCFKNGSLTRQRIRDLHAHHSWEEFDALLCCTPPGNNGFVGIYMDEPEITPKIQGIFRYDGSDQNIERFEESATEVRALIESQFLAKRVHAQRLGFNIGPQCRVLATGGASTNTAILQVLSDVFNATVFIQDTANSSCLGSAYRAAHGLRTFQKGNWISFNEFVGNRRPSFTPICSPRPDAAKVYDQMVLRYASLEHSIICNK